MRTKRKGISLLIFSFFFVFASYLYQELPFSISVKNRDGSTATLHLTRRQAKILRAFFKRLLIWNPFGYTFSGCKPVSFSGYQKPFSSFSSICPPNLEMILGWRCWQEQFSNFCPTRLVFWEEENPWVKNDTLIVAMDRYHASAILKQNRDVFEKHAKVPVDPSIVNPITFPFFKDVLGKNDLLMGIVLGFGRENAQYYADKVQSCDWETMHNQLVWGTDAMEREARKLWWKWITLQEITISDMLRPAFIAKPNPETGESKLLKDQFIEARQKMIEYFNGKDLLEASLALIKNGPLFFRE